MGPDAVRLSKKSKTLRKPAPETQSNGRAAAGFLAALGREVRRGRAKRGMTRRQLALASHTSERYLAQIESGTGNPSVTVLRAIAQALDIPAANLLGEPAAQSGERAALLEAMAQLPDRCLAELTQLIEARFLPPDRADRARRIALVGLRGAGKSTLGRMLARHLGCAFIELDRVVEQDYGASIPDMIEMAGTATFRRHERAALTRVIGEHEAAVITTAGGIVSDRDSYALLLRRSHTIWIKARPEDHMSRVMAQGDFRPMAQNREAMTDLVAILDARSPDYARAQAQLDTSGETIEQTFAKLVRIVTDLVGPTGADRRISAGGARP
jgi:XRE family transcriptional regulator, aerobic/anaerobic benzoate catabolism transcriptional regulator